MGYLSDPASQGGELIHLAFDIALNAISGRLIAQAGGQSLFNDGVYYNPASDAYEGFVALEQDVLDDLLAKSIDGTQVSDKTAFWISVINTLDQAVGVDNLTVGDLAALEATLVSSDSDLTVQKIQDKIQKNIDDNFSLTLAGDYINGTNSDDVYNGTIGDDYYSATYGNDTLFGDIGDDYLMGGHGNDVLIGGLGDDTLRGDAGDDVFQFNLGHGNDSVQDSYGVDKIVFGEGITADDLSFVRSGPYGLLITIDPSVGAGSILIENQFQSYGSIETLEFSDGSTFDPYAIDQHTYIGTEAGESLTGISSTWGGAGNDHIYGLGGNDTLYGYDGDDLLDGGEGNDVLRGYQGNDIYHMGLGNDYVVETLSGDDTFVYTGGLDKIYHTGGGDDVLVLDIDTTINDISFVQSGHHHNLVIDSGVNEIELQYFLYNYTYTTETVEFQDGFSTSLSNYQSWISGTSSADTLAGTASTDTLIGKDGDDVISGLAGDDDIHGGAGNDSLYGGDGLDNLWGGDGSDSFIFESGSAFNDIDVVGDFDLSENDVVDVTDLLSGYDALTDAISDFVQITDNGTDSSLFVDADGGADNFVQIATLLNVTGLTDEDSLEASGNLIAA